MPESITPIFLADQPDAICTLFEGHYHLGLAAFVNSLVRAGYTGTIWAGYRGALPPWLNQLEPISTNDQKYRVANQLQLCFLKLHTTMHLTNFKPQFMLDLLAGEARDANYLWYFDPDIYLRCTWSFFMKWQRYGIALCQENLHEFPESHPMRRQWAEIATEIGLHNPRPVQGYVNGGMVGVPAKCIDFLKTWQDLITLSTSHGGDLYSFMPGKREGPFHASDQDALNIAIMYTQEPLSVAGPSDMGFATHGFIVYHSVGLKPWKVSLLGKALRGWPPSNADKFYLTQVSSPIQAFTPSRLRLKKMACAIAAFIGRFYSRK